MNICASKNPASTYASPSAPGALHMGFSTKHLNKIIQPEYRKNKSGWQQMSISHKAITISEVSVLIHTEKIQKKDDFERQNS